MAGTPVIRTPDRRLRVFVSSTLGELAPERQAVRQAWTAAADAAAPVLAQARATVRSERFDECWRAGEEADRSTCSPATPSPRRRGPGSMPAMHHRPLTTATGPVPEAGSSH